MMKRYLRAWEPLIWKRIRIIRFGSLVPDASSSKYRRMEKLDGAPRVPAEDDGGVDDDEGLRINESH
jgi:hypothetical protein